ncbi:MAG: transglutaminase [Flavobacteriales bacterium]|nr:transglutaminase [Flavobacteriales bacterium]
MSEYLQPTSFFDGEHPQVGVFTDAHVDADSLVDRAVQIYQAVRDEFQYQPFDIRLKAEQLHSSQICNKGFGHCIDKASFLISCCRHLGIPARLGLARVRNHVGTERLEQILGTNVLVPHGYVEMYLDDKWVKCTPAFDKGMCRKLGVEVLEFNGKDDSIFQPYDREGADFMEYLEDYGTFADLPLDFIIELMKKEYPQFFDGTGFIRLL